MNQFSNDRAYQAASKTATAMMDEIAGQRGAGYARVVLTLAGLSSSISEIENTAKREAMKDMLSTLLATLSMEGSKVTGQQLIEAAIDSAKIREAFAKAHDEAERDEATEDVLNRVDEAIAAGAAPDVSDLLRGYAQPRQ